MERLTVLLMGILMANHATADIIVQPGYGQPPQSRLAKLQTVNQPSETVPGSQDREQQHQDYNDPGYHLELHPVYHESVELPGMKNMMMPGMSGPPASRQAHPDMAGYGYAGIPLIIPPPQYYPYVPTVVHSRHRRSNSEELDTAAQRNKRDDDDVAEKPTLDNNLAIVDLQDQDEKRVSTRQSVSLLNLNPANMHPVYQQYRSPEPGPTYDEKAGIQQIQVSPQEATRRQVQLEELQRPMLMQQQEQRDPKAISVSAESSLAESSKDRVESHTSSVPKHAGTSDHEEIVGTRWGGKYKVKVVHHLHQHGRMSDAAYPARESNANQHSPDNAGYETSNNLAQPTGAQQVVQVYQLPNVPGTTYLQNPQYTLESRLDPVNYASNYVLSNPTTASSPFRICFENPDNAQPIVYQLA